MDKFLKPGSYLHLENGTMIVFEGLAFNLTPLHYPFARPNSVYTISQRVSAKVPLGYIIMSSAYP